MPTTPRMKCDGCSRYKVIEDVLDMPPFYCPNCGEKRHVEYDASVPDEALTDTL